MVAVSPLTSTLGLSIPIVKYRRLPSAMSAKYSKGHSICHIIGVMGPLALVKRADRSHIIIGQLMERI